MAVIFIYWVSKIFMRKIQQSIATGYILFLLGIAQFAYAEFGDTVIRLN